MIRKDVQGILVGLQHIVKGDLKDLFGLSVVPQGVVKDPYWTRATPSRTYQVSVWVLIGSLQNSLQSVSGSPKTFNNP